MDKSCKICRKWQSHHYWNHRDLKKMKFFVKMEEASFRNHLKLPAKFTRNFNGKINGRVKLKGPSGRIWQIEVLNSENRLSLKSGWRKFVAANQVDVDDLLVFKYSGNSSFDVFIFDTNGCEKVDSFSMNNEETETESDSESQSEEEKSSSDSSIEVFVLKSEEKDLSDEPELISPDHEISPGAIHEKKLRGK